VSVRIDVRRLGDEEYQVILRDAADVSTHTVRLSDHDRGHYGGAASAERVVEASFRFLLEREPRDQILERFEIATIARYFPDYKDYVRRALAG
jgi:hypothetical protein